MQSTVEQEISRLKALIFEEASYALGTAKNVEDQKRRQKKRVEHLKIQKNSLSFKKQVISNRIRTEFGLRQSTGFGKAEQMDLFKGSLGILSFLYCFWHSGPTPQSWVWFLLVNFGFSYRLI